MAKALVLDVEGWQLQVQPHGEGFMVGIATDTKPATIHYVRLDDEQSEQLLGYLMRHHPAPQS